MRAISRVPANNNGSFVRFRTGCGVASAEGRAAATGKSASRVSQVERDEILHVGNVGSVDRRVKTVRLTALGAKTKRRLLERLYEPPQALLDLDRQDLESLKISVSKLPVVDSPLG